MLIIFCNTWRKHLFNSEGNENVQGMGGGIFVRISNVEFFRILLFLSVFG